MNTCSLTRICKHCYWCTFMDLWVTSLVTWIVIKCKYYIPKQNFRKCINTVSIHNIHITLLYCSLLRNWLMGMCTLLNAVLLGRFCSFSDSQKSLFIQLNAKRSILHSKSNKDMTVNDVQHALLGHKTVPRRGWNSWQIRHICHARLSNKSTKLKCTASQQHMNKFWGHVTDRLFGYINVEFCTDRRYDCQIFFPPQVHLFSVK